MGSRAGEQGELQLGNISQQARLDLSITMTEGFWILQQRNINNMWPWVGTIDRGRRF